METPPGSPDPKRQAIQQTPEAMRTVAAAAAAAAVAAANAAAPAMRTRPCLPSLQPPSAAQLVQMLPEEAAAGAEPSGAGEELEMPEAAEPVAALPAAAPEPAAAAAAPSTSEAVAALTAAAAEPGAAAAAAAGRSQQIVAAGDDLLKTLTACAAEMARMPPATAAAAAGAFKELAPLLAVVQGAVAVLDGIQLAPLQPTGQLRPAALAAIESLAQMAALLASLTEQLASVPQPDRAAQCADRLAANGVLHLAVIGQCAPLLPLLLSGEPPLVNAEAAWSGQLPSALLSLVEDAYGPLDGLSASGPAIDSALRLAARIDALGCIAALLEGGANPAGVANLQAAARALPDSTAIDPILRSAMLRQADAYAVYGLRLPLLSTAGELTLHGCLATLPPAALDRVDA